MIKSNSAPAEAAKAPSPRDGSGARGGLFGGQCKERTLAISPKREDRMIPIILAVAVAAAPSPKPTPLKVIIHIRSNTTFCSSVRSMAVPIGYVTRRNDEAFAAMNHSVLKYFESVRGVTSAGVPDMEALSSELDDSAIYTPTGALSAMKVGQIAYDVDQNLTLEDRIMQDSWTKYPKGAYPNIDAMRDRLQNLMDLQRALVARYTEFASVYTDNAGQAKFADDAASFKSLLRDTILGLSSALAHAHDPEEYTPAYGTVHELARAGRVSDVVKELKLQEMAFSNEIVGAGNSCGI